MLLKHTLVKDKLADSQHSVLYSTPAREKPPAWQAEVHCSTVIPFGPLGTPCAYVRVRAFAPSLKQPTRFQPVDVPEIVVLAAVVVDAPPAGAVVAGTGAVALL